MLNDEDLLRLKKDQICEAAEAAANGWQNTRWDEIRSMKALKEVLKELKALKKEIAERK
jgi:hypothetical protein